MEASTSKGRGNPHRRKEFYYFLSRLFKKLQMNVPSVEFSCKIFELRFCQRELKLALKFLLLRKNVNSLQLHPDKRSNMRRWFRKARGHHHSSHSLLSDALADSGASQGRETCSKSTRTYQVACFQKKRREISMLG